MSISLYNILNKTIKSKSRLLTYECKHRDFFNNHHIGFNSKFKLIQSGGYNYEYKENDISYNVEIYENEYNKSDSDYEYINKYIYIYKTILDPNSSYCCLLSYYNNDILHIDVLETPVKCIKINMMNNYISRDLINTKYKYGDIMMKIIIKIAKEKGFKQIRLEDKSMFNCLDSKNKLKYSLKNVHILTHGYPWYYKYGFKFIDKDYHKAVKFNYNTIIKLKTKDIIFDKFIKLIEKKITNSKEIYINDSIIFNDIIIDDIKLIYNNHSDDNICKFFDEFTHEHCELMTLIYEKLFKTLGLKYINGENMILNLT
jgi:hypothetical protein